MPQKVDRVERGSLALVERGSLALPDGAYLERGAASTLDVGNSGNGIWQLSAKRRPGCLWLGADRSIVSYSSAGRRTIVINAVNGADSTDAHADGQSRRVRFPDGADHMRARNWLLTRMVNDAGRAINAPGASAGSHPDGDSPIFARVCVLANARDW